MIQPLITVKHNYIVIAVHALSDYKIILLPSSI